MAAIAPLKDQNRIRAKARTLLLILHREEFEAIAAKLYEAEGFLVPRPRREWKPRRPYRKAAR